MSLFREMQQKRQKLTPPLFLYEVTPAVITPNHTTTSQWQPANSSHFCKLCNFFLLECTFTRGSFKPRNDWLALLFSNLLILNLLWLLFHLLRTEHHRPSHVQQPVSFFCFLFFCARGSARDRKLWKVGHMLAESWVSRPWKGFVNIAFRNNHMNNNHF